MVDLNDIYSLSDFQRNTKAYIERLKGSGRPQVLTINGKSEIIIQDAEAYQKTLDYIDRLEALAGIRRGIEEVRSGKTKPASEVFDAMRSKHKIPARS